MGKKRHSQDKLWITYKELVEDWGGKREEESRTNTVKKLPFYCCQLSFMPFKDPVCLPDGTIFDIINILPYIRKYKKNPVSGKPLKSSDLIKLNFHKNAEGEFHCPITYKVFTENSYIIAIKETGNVFSYEAFDELNKRPKNFSDLLTNEKFDPEKIIVIQDPNEFRKNIFEFDFVKNKENVDFIHYGENVSRNDFMEKTENFVNIPSRYKEILDNYEENNEDYNRKLEIIKTINNNTNIIEEDERIKLVKSQYEKFIDNLNFIEKELANCEVTDEKKIKEFFMIESNIYVYHIRQKNLEQNSADKNKKNNLIFSEGKLSTSFTSTSFNPVSENKLKPIPEDEIRNNYRSIVKSRKLKGYVKLITNFGALNLLIHCDLAPRTSENFIELCQKGYYNDTIFHRLVKGFCLQGGDPTGTGTGGNSIYGKPFEDEFHKNLNHSGKGILSMANSGKNSNSSQFFFCLKSVPHLDNVHSVFGEVVGNLKLLDELENIGSDKENNKPKKEIKILSVEVFSNPFREVISEILLKEFSEKIMKEKLNENLKIDLLVKDKIIEKGNFNNKNSKGNLLNFKEENSNENAIGKYLGKKRESTRGNISEINKLNNEDPYLYEKNPNSKNRNKYKFDFSNW